MRSITSSVFSLFILFSMPGAAPAFGQESRIRLDGIDRLAAQATEAIDINVDGALLKLVATVLPGTKVSSAAKIKELISGIDGIYIRRLEFDKEGGYRTEDVEMIRAQVRPPAWTRVVGVRAGRGRNHVEAYVKSEGNNITGVTIISAEPRELVVANVTGIIDIDKLAELFREIDLPWLEWTEPRKREKE
ncbi:MAG TPA: DUF4252 domain-containing protein [Blastocatellia bacterium]|nr:DUF4252 domain-containing protein [Blastocatellia bacterium]